MDATTLALIDEWFAGADGQAAPTPVPAYVVPDQSAASSRLGLGATEATGDRLLAGEDGASRALKRKLAQTERVRVVAEREKSAGGAPTARGGSGGGGGGGDDDDDDNGSEDEGRTRVLGNKAPVRGKPAVASTLGLKHAVIASAAALGGAAGAKKKKKKSKAKAAATVAPSVEASALDIGTPVAASASKTVAPVNAPSTNAATDAFSANVDCVPLAAAAELAPPPPAKRQFVVKSSAELAALRKARGEPEPTPVAAASALSDEPLKRVRTKSRARQHKQNLKRDKRTEEVKAAKGVGAKPAVEVAAGEEGAAQSVADAAPRIDE